MKTQKGKLDLSKQNKAQNYLDGWKLTSQRLRTIAVYIVLGVIGLTIFLSIVSHYKYFPKEPTNNQIYQFRLKQAIQKFHAPAH